jgi:beta-1,4-mannosyltransferase
MNVLMVSQWAVNPYQKLLIAQLEKLGVSVSEESPSVRRLLFRGRPHVIHLQNIRPFLTSRRAMVSLARIGLFALRLLIARGMRARIVWTAHDLTNPNGKHPFIDRLATMVVARVAHEVIVHDETAASRVIRAAWVSRRTVHVIPHGSYAGYYPNTITRTDARAALKIAEGDTVFLLFGSMRRYKGVLELIRAFQRVRATRARLVLAGRPSGVGLEAEIRAEAADDDRISLHLRTIPDADVQVYMNAADAAVFPYSRVLTSGAVVLAKSFGKACIVASGSGVDEDGALLYDPHDENALTRALESAAEDRARLTRCSAVHDWQSVAEATLQLYS